MADEAGGWLAWSASYLAGHSALWAYVFGVHFSLCGDCFDSACVRAPDSCSVGVANNLWDPVEALSDEMPVCQFLHACRDSGSVGEWVKWLVGTWEGFAGFVPVRVPGVDWLAGDLIYNAEVLLGYVACDWAEISW